MHFFTTLILSTSVFVFLLQSVYGPCKEKKIMILFNSNLFVCDIVQP